MGEHWIFQTSVFAADEVKTIYVCISSNCKSLLLFFISYCRENVNFVIMSASALDAVVVILAIISRRRDEKWSTDRACSMLALANQVYRIMSVIGTYYCSVPLLT
jgi:hypothetical protein